MVLLPLVSVIAFIALFLFYYYYLNFNKAATITHEYVRKTIWAVSAFLYAVALIANISACAWVLKRHWYDSVSGLLFYTRWSIIVVIAVVASVMTKFSVSGETADKIFDENHIKKLTIFHNVVAVIAVGMVLICAAVLLDNYSVIGVDLLRKRLVSLRACLFTTSVLLAAGVFEVTALFRMEDTLPASDNSAPDLAGAVSLGAGLGFAALMAILFIPVANALSNRLDELASFAAAAAYKAGSQFSYESWRISENLSEIPLGSFTQQMFLFLPVVAGLFSRTVQVYLNGGQSGK